MQITAPAKINWDLRILGKRADAFHELDSIFVTTSIHDVLTFTHHAGLLLTCSDPCLPVDGGNLIVRAARLLAETAGVACAANIHVEKHIPMGGGMGGGSSDAASTLRALNRFWNLNWPLEKLAPLAAQLGSDVSFFLYGGWALCRGRGEIVEPLPGTAHWEPLKLAIVLPPLHVSTPMVYKALNALPLSNAGGRTAAQAASELNDAFKLLRTRAGCGLCMRNDLTAAAVQIEPRLKLIQNVLDRHLAGHWLMSGSGSSHFAVLPDGFTGLEQITEELKHAVPGTRVVPAHTVAG
jgi:4-diphosphocytidyl-2-C-methyl-D-erythritol kinase